MAKKNGSAQKRPSRYHHGDLRAALLQLSFEEIERSGFESISLAALAKALHVSQAAPYRHFADREALLVAVATTGFQRFGEALLAALVGQPARRHLGCLARAYVDFALASPQLYRLMFGSRLLAAAAATDALKLAADASFASLLAVFEAEMATPRAQREALGAWSSLHGLVLLWQEGLLSSENAPIDLAELVDDAVRRHEPPHLGGRPAEAPKRRRPSGSRG